MPRRAVGVGVHTDPRARRGRRRLRGRARPVAPRPALDPSPRAPPSTRRLAPRPPGAPRDGAPPQFASEHRGGRLPPWRGHRQGRARPGVPRDRPARRDGRGDKGDSPPRPRRRRPPRHHRRDGPPLLPLPPERRRLPRHRRDQILPVHRPRARRERQPRRHRQTHAIRTLPGTPRCRLRRADARRTRLPPRARRRPPRRQGRQRPHHQRRRRQTRRFRRRRSRPRRRRTATILTRRRPRGAGHAVLDGARGDRDGRRDGGVGRVVRRVHGAGTRHRRAAVFRHATHARHVRHRERPETAAPGTRLTSAERFSQTVFPEGSEDATVRGGDARARVDPPRERRRSAKRGRSARRGRRASRGRERLRGRTRPPRRRRFGRGGLGTAGGDG